VPISPWALVSLNKPVDAKTAKKIAETFYEIVVAPSFEKEALSILEEKKNLRLIERQFWAEGFDVKRTDAGLLVQTRDEYVENEKDFKVVTKAKPNNMTELIFAMKICRHVKSNAIVLTKDGATIGVGAGQMSRIDSLQNAAKKAGEKAKGAVLASDAFFPFKDNVDLAAQIGIKEIIQPGGSVRDQESIDACNEYGISMVFTGIRHFKH
jgi:phosphoribosylaminoimidazolecarboxamide formyltransferase/IMP cyclohydrolase